MRQHIGGFPAQNGIPEDQRGKIFPGEEKFRGLAAQKNINFVVHGVQQRGEPCFGADFRRKPVPPVCGFAGITLGDATNAEIIGIIKHFVSDTVPVLPQPFSADVVKGLERYGGMPRRRLAYLHYFGTAVAENYRMRFETESLLT